MRYAGWWLRRETLTLLWFNRGKVWWARLDLATPAVGAAARAEGRGR
jgi:hypothetical protein